MLHPLQRRCYWLLESEDDIVLVHYLNIPQRHRSRRISTRLHSGSLTREESLDHDASIQSERDSSNDASNSSDLDTPEPSANRPTQQHVVDMPAIPSPDDALHVPCLSTMSFDAFLAAMDPKNDMTPVQAGGLPAQEMLQRWNEEHHLAVQARPAQVWRVL